MIAMVFWQVPTSSPSDIEMLLVLPNWEGDGRYERSDGYAKATPESLVLMWTQTKASHGLGAKCPEYDLE